MNGNIETTIKLDKLSNQEILELLKKFNLQVGPVTKTTRSIYEKRLKKLFDEMDSAQRMDWNEIVKEETAATVVNDLNLAKKRKHENQTQ